MKAKAIILLGAIACSEFLMGLFGQTADPTIRTQLSLDSVNGNNVVARSYEHTRSYVRPVSLITYSALAALLFWPRNRGAAEKQPVK